MVIAATIFSLNPSHKGKGDSPISWRSGWGVKRLNPSHKGKGDSVVGDDDLQVEASLNPSHKGKGDSCILGIILLGLLS